MPAAQGCEIGFNGRKPMNRFARLSAGLLALTMGLGMGGCSSSGSPEPADTAVVPGQGVRLEVTNEQRTEAEIWVLVDGSRQRLGRVASYDNETFLIPMDRPRTLRMEFRIFGGPTCVTREVSRRPGESVSYTIPVDIRVFDAVCR